MDRSSRRKRAYTLAWITLTAVAATFVAQDARTDEPVLELGEVTFEPPYVIADENTHRVKVKLGPLPTSSSSASLDLEELPADLGELPIPVGTLRPDGRGGFEGVGEFDRPVCGARRLQVTDPGTGQVSSTLELPSARAYLATTVFEPIDKFESSFDYDIDVSDSGPGQLILTVNGAARVGDTSDTVVTVELDGKRELRVPPDTDCVEQIIDLKANSRTLNIDAQVPEGEQVTVRVDAIANYLEIRTLEQPSLSAGRPLRTEIYVEAPGGYAVPDAEILSRLESKATVENVSRTNNEGVAEVVFAAEQVGDSAVLTADVVNVRGPVADRVEDLTDQIGVKPEELALVSVAPSTRSLTVEADDKVEVDLTVRVNAKKGKKFKINVTHDVFPSDGLAVTQSTRVLKGKGPTTFIVGLKLDVEQALDLYQVYVDFKQGPRGEAVSAYLEVDVTEPDSGGQLQIHPPVSDPAIFRESDLTVDNVVFKALVSGTSKPPAFLEFKQVDEFEDVLDSPGDLRDDGVPPDAVAEDRVYTGQFAVNGTPEARNFYQAWAPSPSDNYSHSYSLEIVPDGFPTELQPPSDFDEIVEEPGTGDRFVADQVLVKFRQHVSPARMLEIVESLGSASMLGFEPVLEVAQVDFSGDSTAETVRRVQAALQAFDEVEFVAPNQALVAAQAAPGYPDEQMLDKVRAREAWLGAGGTLRPADRRNVAVIDDPVENPSLNERLAPEGRRKSCTGDSGNSHGTAVAGVVAAIMEGWDRTGQFLLPVTVKSTGSQSSALVCALSHVAQHPEWARVATISLGWNSSQLSDKNNEKDELQDAVLKVVQESGILIVAAAGNARTENQREVKFYPAAFNHPGVIAVANTDRNDAPYNGSGNDREKQATRRGPWIDLAAPGVDVLTLMRGGGTTTRTGTSFSAPQVAAAASILWAQNPDMGPAQIARLLKTAAHPIEATDVGVGRLDIAEAIVNGSVELASDMAGSPTAWSSAAAECVSEEVPEGRPRVFYQARDRRKFLECQGADGLSRTQKRIVIPAGVAQLELTASMAAAAAAAPLRRAALVVRLERPDGTSDTLRTVRAKMSRKKCGALADTRRKGTPPGEGCSGWKRLRAVVSNPPAGNSTIVFEARHGNAGTVWLLLDELKMSAKRR